MSLVETESLILKTYSLAEADRIVVLLTRDHGVVRGVAKGAKRLLSKFGSGLETFSSVRVTYFQKEVLELVAVEKVDLLLLAMGFLGPEKPGMLEQLGVEVLTAGLALRAGRRCASCVTTTKAVLVALEVHLVRAESIRVDALQ